MKRLRAATVEEIATVPGMGERTAAAVVAALAGETATPAGETAAPAGAAAAPVTPGPGPAGMLGS
ncbi:Helix-hairpin-helix motif protein [compost metagenome]